MIKTIFCFFVALMLCAMVVCGGCGYLATQSALPKGTSIEVKHNGKEVAKMEAKKPSQSKDNSKFADEVMWILDGIDMGILTPHVERQEAIRNYKNRSGPRVTAGKPEIGRPSVKSRMDAGWYPEESGGR